MKSLIALTLFIQSMSFIQFEDLIGKDIYETNYLFNHEGFENELFGDDIYYTRNGDFKYYNEVPYNMFSITKNQRIITSITIYFYKIVDLNFYNSLILSYGKPDNILIIDNLEIKKEVTNNSKGFKQKLKKGNIKTKEGVFEEEPLFIFWKKKIEIKLFLRYEQNKSELTFRIPINKI